MTIRRARSARAAGTAALLASTLVLAGCPSGDEPEDDGGTVQEDGGGGENDDGDDDGNDDGDDDDGDG